MSANDKRFCKACGAEYKYCPNCVKYARMPKWMWKCDTAECNAIFDAISAYKMGVKDKNVIKEVIDEYNIKDYSKYTESIQNTLNALFPIRKNKKKNVEEIMDVDLDDKTEVEPVATKVVATEEPITVELEGTSEE